MQLGAAEDALSTDPEAAQSHIRRARELARGSLDEARRSVHTLRSPRLEHEELMTALERLAREVTAGTGVRVRTLLVGNTLPLPDDVPTHLLRIGQEALTNALRHAQADQILIRLDYTPDLVRLTIEDNGIGFHPEAISEHGFGLQGMRERIQGLGGLFTLFSQPGQGTTVEACVPLPNTSLTAPREEIGP